MKTSSFHKKHATKQWTNNSLMKEKLCLLRFSESHTIQTDISCYLRFVFGKSRRGDLQHDLKEIQIEA